MCCGGLEGATLTEKSSSPTVLSQVESCDKWQLDLEPKQQAKYLGMLTDLVVERAYPTESFEHSSLALAIGPGSSVVYEKAFAS